MRKKGCRQQNANFSRQKCLYLDNMHVPIPYIEDFLPLNGATFHNGELVDNKGQFLSSQRAR